MILILLLINLKLLALSVLLYETQRNFLMNLEMVVIGIFHICHRIRKKYDQYQKFFKIFI